MLLLVIQPVKPFGEASWCRHVHPLPSRPIRHSADRPFTPCPPVNSTNKLKSYSIHMAPCAFFPLSKTQHKSTVAHPASAAVAPSPIFLFNPAIQLAHKNSARALPRRHPLPTCKRERERERVPSGWELHKPHGSGNPVPAQSSNDSSP